MDLIRKKTVISSYPNKDVSLSIDIEHGLNYEQLYNKIKKAFVTNNDTSRLSVTTDSSAYQKNIIIKGIVIWDDIPVTDLQINFNITGKMIVQIQATHFTFHGCDKSRLECEKTELDKFNYPETLIERDNLTCSVYFYHLNSCKFINHYDDTTKIILQAFPSYEKDYKATLDAFIARTRKVGLPILVSTGPVSSILELNCNNNPKEIMDKLERVDKTTWRYPSAPAFLLASFPALLFFSKPKFPYQLYCVEEITFHANKSFGIPKKWKEIRITVSPSDCATNLISKDLLNTVINPTEFIKTHDYSVNNNIISIRAF